MTRKDYVRIADAIAAARADLDPRAKEVIDVLAWRIAVLVLEPDNPRFDRTLFLDACRDARTYPDPMAVTEEGDLS